MIDGLFEYMPAVICRLLPHIIIFYQSPCVETAKKIGFACLRLLQYNGIDWPLILRNCVMSKRDHRENNSTHRL